MNEKAQALVDALRGVGINVEVSSNSNGHTEIDIPRLYGNGANDHIKWDIGNNIGVGFIIDSNGKIKEITE